MVSDRPQYPTPRDGNALVGLFWATVLSLPMYALIYWAIWG